MIQIEIQFKDEDAFNYYLNNSKDEQFNRRNITILDTNETSRVSYIIHMNNGKYVNSMLKELENFCDLFKTDILFRHVYTIHEAYTGIDAISKYPINFRSLKRITEHNL